MPYFRSKFLWPALAAACLAACGGETTDENVSANDAAAPLSFEGANDQSALELVANDTQGDPGPATGNDAGAAGGNDASAAEPVIGNTSGGDTGGNTVEGNIAGL